MKKILVVDDEEGIRSFVAECLQTKDREIIQAADGDEAALHLGRSGFDLVITDLKMPGLDGLELLALVKREQPETEVILLTAHGSVGDAVDAMQKGAFDFVEKPVGSPKALRHLVDRALERRALRGGQELRARTRVRSTLSYGAPAMKPVIGALSKVAGTNASVLLLGESGSGKEVAARFVHENSERRDEAFVAINCAALTESLLESELFGHESGAFTGAQERRRGRVELADGGTFFLDEVGELAPALQAKLLRVLEEGTFERLGGERSFRVNVRWVAATNQDLGERMRSGQFREDLYHRLAVFPVHLPPLRERREDIVPLARHLLETIASDLGRPQLELHQDAETELSQRPWPGNVRELRNALERAAILAEDAVITTEDLWRDPALAASPDEEFTGSLAEIEERAIRSALERADGNRKKAAEELGIGLRTLYDKLKRYGAD